MLRLARDYATERIQFGRPISSFQAVRHRLADSLVAVAAAEASVAAAWEVGSPFTASVAKAVAGRSARVVARHSQQVLAGMGFTAEHPLHRFVKRALTLDQTLGASGTITRGIGGELLRSGKLPAALPL
jgi:alkylation response protein AidB-like acyl-CoA dehydrogenase